MVSRESDSIEYYIWVASQLTGFDICKCLLQVRKGEVAMEIVEEEEEEEETIVQWGQ